LDEYLIRRTQVGTSSPAVFVSQQGTALSYSTVVTVFLSLIRAIGLRAGPGQLGPCLHDLRHHADNRIMPSHRPPFFFLS
jgi:integrase